jgi:hypothetical protein
MQDDADDDQQPPAPPTNVPSPSQIPSAILEEMQDDADDDQQPPAPPTNVPSPSPIPSPSPRPTSKRAREDEEALVGDDSIQDDNDDAMDTEEAEQEVTAQEDDNGEAIPEATQNSQDAEDVETIRELLKNHKGKVKLCGAFVLLRQVMKLGHKRINHQTKNQDNTTKCIQTLLEKLDRQIGKENKNEASPHKNKKTPISLQ